MGRKTILFALLLSITSLTVFAQGEKKWLKHRITTLAADNMHGRGYVNKGGDKAASYIRRNFEEFGLLPFDTDSTYFQPYTFPVNTFPGQMAVKINRKELEPGKDFLTDAGNTTYHTDKIKLRNLNLATVKDSAAWEALKLKIDPRKAYFVKNADTLSKYLKLNIRSFATAMPQGVFIVPKHGKLTWLVRMDTNVAHIVYVEDTVLPRRAKKAAIHTDSKFFPAFKTQNVMAFVPGTEQPDSFIVFTAHYDHLGHMGKTTIFPGAHDNASGTSLVLYLASYFAQHPQKYSVAFMLFSGEEAGLMGSKNYVAHPVFPLGQIRFVVNLDMTGDAETGITVVNANTVPKEFALLDSINKHKSYLATIKQRDQTRNSDHYSFSEKGVPAVFIYGNGSKTPKGFYHDIYDKAKELSLQNIDGLAKLLIDFTAKLPMGE
jgi:aminopeptidase YwaD